MIYSLTATGLTPGGSSTVHIYTQTIHRTTQITTNLQECGPCPIFASFTLSFALQLRKKYGETSVRVRKTSVRVRKTSVRVQYTYYQNTPIFIVPYYVRYPSPPCDTLFQGFKEGLFYFKNKFCTKNINFPMCHCCEIYCF